MRVAVQQKLVFGSEGIAFRINDDSNYLRFIGTAAPLTNGYVLQKVESGTIVDLATDTTVAAHGDVLGVECVGSIISCKVNHQTRIVHQIGTNITDTKAGLIAISNASFDNFRAWGIS